MSSWKIQEALGSARRLEKVICQLTEEEIVQAIALEEESGRRKAILDRLRRQARVLGRQQCANQLADKVERAK